MTLVLRCSALSLGARAECRFLGVLIKWFGSFTHHSIGDIGFEIPDELPNYRRLIGRDTLEVLYRMMIVSATRLLDSRIECNV
jgi:hypothetical protein